MSGDPANTATTATPATTTATATAAATPTTTATTVATATPATTVATALTTTAVGRTFEDAAWEHLAGHGYRMVTRNYRTRGGEIDIIAFDGDVLCFVEVRGRAESDHGDPLETISPVKVGRVIRAARAYLETLPQPWPIMRFDVIGLTGNPPRDIRLIREAFDDSRVGA